MPVLRFLVSLVVTTILTLFLNGNIQIPDLPLPAPGMFFSPFHGFWQQAEPVAKASDLSTSLETLEDPTEVIYDHRLVPHIFTGDLTDALMVQGYLHAKYRLWQMDISTRASAGRVAEVLGERALEYDLFQRRKGILRTARASVELWREKDPFFPYIEAYTKGVNAYINELSPRDYPLEFKLLGYTPEKWTPVKTALMLANMTQVLCGRNDDFMHTNALQVLGKETFDFLFPEYNPRQSPVIPDEVEWDYFDPAKPADEEPPAVLIGGAVNKPDWPNPAEHIGSNNWALSGQKTADGHPLLCNDPHLELTLPSIWYEMHMVTNDRNVYGASLPGIPGFPIGFNDHVAFGLTNVGQDVLDWYRLEWADEQHSSYYLNGEVFQVEMYPEKINVRNGKTVIDTVKWSIWGPLPYPEDSIKHNLAMHWVAHDISKVSQVNGILKINAASDYTEFDEASSVIDFPAQNMVFASRDDHIALKVQGKFPLKNPGDGRFIHPGNTSEYGWKDYISKRHIPKVIDPQRGFVASANQRSTSLDYPYYYNGYFDDYRGRYLNRRLEKLNKATIADMKALQTDNHSILAEEALPVLLSHIDDTKLNKESRKLYERLVNWDHSYNGPMVEPSIFMHLYDLIYQKTWDECYVIRDKMPFPSPDDWRHIQLMEEDPDNPFFDNKQTPEVETLTKLVQESFSETAEWAAILGTEDELRWSNQKCFSIRHLGRIPAFGTGALEVGGFGQALNAINEDRGTGPSWRMIVSLGENIEAWGVYPGGQSGNPGSPFYDSFIDTWAQGEYYPLICTGDTGLIQDQALFSQSFNP